MGEPAESGATARRREDEVFHPCEYQILSCSSQWAAVCTKRPMPSSSRDGRPLVVVWDRTSPCTAKHTDPPTSALPVALSPRPLSPSARLRRTRAGPRVADPASEHDVIGVQPFWRGWTAANGIARMESGNRPVGVAQLDLGCGSSKKETWGFRDLGVGKAEAGSPMAANGGGTCRLSLLVTHGLCVHPVPSSASLPLRETAKRQLASSTGRGPGCLEPKQHLGQEPETALRPAAGLGANSAEPARSRDATLALDLSFVSRVLTGAVKGRWYRVLRYLARWSLSRDVAIRIRLAQVAHHYQMQTARCKVLWLSRFCQQTASKRGPPIL